MVPTVVRSLISSSRASCIEWQTLVPTSICERRNSGLTWPPFEQGLLAFGEQGRGRLGEVAAVLVDEEIFLLDAEGEAWFADGHGGAMWHNSMTACSRFRA